MNDIPAPFDLDPRIECAWTIPARMYTDPAVLEQERRRIFHRTWQLAGNTGRPCGEGKTIRGPETYFTADVAGEPVVVCRDKDGALRAFSNVCRHRAGPVAQGAGCRRTLQCGYHGWTYALDGRLIGTPEVDGVEFFDRSTMGLVPLRIEAWEPFLFVNCDASAPALATFVESIPEEAKGLQLAGMRLAERREYTVQCNWKVYVDNYLEGYHIPIAHPGLMKEIDYSQYRVETRRYSSRQHAPIRAAGNDASRAYGKPGEPDAALYYWIFPNLMLNLYPDNLQINVIVPLTHERTLTIFEWYCHEPESATMKEKLAKAVAFSHQVQMEDIALCEAVQRGLRSTTYDRGRYSPRRENGVHHFHSLLLEFLAQ